MDGAPSWRDAAVPDGPPGGDVDPDAAPARDRQWPAPDRYTLRAVVEPDLALDTDVTRDAASAVVSDPADGAFGSGWRRWYTEAPDAEGGGDTLGRPLAEDDVAERVLGRRHTARVAQLPPRRCRVAGRRRRDRVPGPRVRRRTAARRTMAGVSRRRPPAPPEPVRSRTPGRAERLTEAMARDGDTCIWCGRVLGGLVPPTTEHVVPRLKGGPSWLANEVAACRRCNAERGHRAPVDWLEECERRGWQPDAGRLTRALDALQEAIDREGGQRRARPYLDAQRRRLRRRPPAGTDPRTVAS